jgi:hypothetical protein
MEEVEDWADCGEREMPVVNLLGPEFYAEMSEMLEMCILQM